MKKVSVKTFEELKPVLAQKNVKLKNNEIIYRVFRSQKKQKNLRYDLTILYPKMLGNEFPKTFGHYHKHNEPEYYEVLKGEAIFILQKPSKDFLKIKEVYAVLVREGEKMIVPKFFGMTMINPTKKELKVGNWIDESVINVYDAYQKAKGAAYYCLKDKNGGVKFVKNKHYKEVPELKILAPQKLPNQLLKLSFLSQPQKFLKFLTIKKLFSQIN
jgi:glucose-6-phosphate isomerase